MRSRLALKQLKRLEKRFCVAQEISDQAAEIMELLRKHEEAMEPIRRSPNAVALELELIEATVQKMVEDGLLVSPLPMSSIEKVEAKAAEVSS